jgi:hypothetical protein
MLVVNLLIVQGDISVGSYLVDCVQGNFSAGS